MHANYFLVKNSSVFINAIAIQSADKTFIEGITFELSAEAQKAIGDDLINKAIEDARDQFAPYTTGEFAQELIKVINIDPGYAYQRPISDVERTLTGPEAELFSTEVVIERIVNIGWEIRKML